MSRDSQYPPFVEHVEQNGTPQGDGQAQEIAYGDPSSNAESMAFRRACANFGLGLDLYEG
jgi:hypothetical protein